MGWLRNSCEPRRRLLRSERQGACSPLSQYHTSSRLPRPSGPSRVSDALFQWNYEQSVFSNMRSAGEVSLDFDFPQNSLDVFTFARMIKSMARSKAMTATKIPESGGG
ncbi:hypothetical protein H106_02663 [Trichophyton rubrum CBS 735.88]|nr:hypothetical protein H106_02663 [Trichophyton rubrum CBS 735.88]